jgi:hypothetical protein
MDALQDAYLHTTYYLVDGNDELPLRIGKPDARLDRLLLQHACTAWAFVSAWNPLSRRTPKAQNEAAHQRLESIVAACGWLHFQGHGTGDRTDWPPEPGLFILGIPLDEALRLGRQFAQLAILAGVRGGAPELHFCLPPATPEPQPAER